VLLQCCCSVVAVLLHCCCSVVALCCRVLQRRRCTTQIVVRHAVGAGEGEKFTNVSSTEYDSVLQCCCSCVAVCCLGKGENFTDVSSTVCDNVVAVLLQCCCSVLQCATVCYRVLQCVATLHNTNSSSDMTWGLMKRRNPDTSAL